MSRLVLPREYMDPERHPYTGAANLITIVSVGLTLAQLTAGMSFSQELKYQAFNTLRPRVYQDGTPEEVAEGLKVNILKSIYCIIEES